MYCDIGVLLFDSQSAFIRVLQWNNLKLIIAPPTNLDYIGSYVYSFDTSLWIYRLFLERNTSELTVARRVIVWCQV